MNSRVITYSPAYTVVPTYECFNRCTYCNFRQEPGQSPWLGIAAAESCFQQLQHQGVSEILILSGEVHPRSDRRQAWFERIVQLCELALARGFLPHTNAGPLSWTEWTRLKQVNVSMGLMLEQQTPALLNTVHRHAPSKQPTLRIEQLIWAGRLEIPFTTGLLLGIGETATDRIDSLKTIAQIHQTWGHIQEVILQPYSPGDREGFSGTAFSATALLDLIHQARDILPDSIGLQVPPNLVQTPEILLAALAAGATDLGGISPHDEVNPTYPHPQIQPLQSLLATAGWQLVPRLPVYPQYDRWLPARLQPLVDRWRSQIAAGQSIP